jgi:UDP-N-acetylmuramoyl-L-alanyl-D-glutamate--2,6-diaminopimelate ligase
MSGVLGPEGATLAWLAALPGTLEARLGAPASVGVGAGPGPRLRIDSRECQPGDLFVARRGQSVDAHQFVPELLARGVHCAVERGWWRAQGGAAGGPGGLLVVADGADWLPRAAARAAGIEFAPLKVHGITGTNGKTSTAWILQHLLLGRDPAAGLVGTVLARIGADSDEACPLTTPDPLWLAAFARRLLEAGGGHLAMEVSSHAVEQRREAVFGYESAVFLNLSPEHLDYHGNMEAYFRAKASFLRRPEPPLRLVAVDEPWGCRLASELDPLPCSTFGRSPRADWRIVDEGVERGARRLSLAGEGRRLDFRVPLLGAHNAFNAAAALLVALGQGLEPGELQARLETLPPVPGRMEPVPLEGGPLVLIDYAHSPDGYEKTFAALAGLVPGRRRVVFGCGGERDRGKRPELLRIALQQADRVWITLDNPRGEDPEQIFADMLAGCPLPGRVERIDDRAAAIAAALAASGPEDLLLLLGKGHERWQLIGGRRLPFDERRVLAEAWKDLKR